MLTLVSVYGELGEKITESSRYIYVDRSVSDDSIFPRDKFIIKPWQGTKNSSIMKLDDTQLVILHGRLENDNEGRTIIIVEMFNKIGKV